MDSGRPRLRRAWTADNARSYTAHLSAVDEDFDTSRASHFATSQSRRPSLFRTAFSLLGAVHDLRKERVRQREPDDLTPRDDLRSRAGFTRSPSAEDRRSNSHDRHARSPNERYYSRHGRRTVDGSPPPRSRRKHRRRDVSYGDPTASSNDNENSSRTRRRTARAPADGTHIQALEREVAFEQSRVKECSQWLQSHAHRADVSDRLIQDMVARLQRHKQNLKDAKAELETAAEQAESQQQAHGRPRTSRRRHTTQNNNAGEAPEMPPGFDDLFNFLLSGGAFPHSNPRERPPFTSQSDLFSQLFADMTVDGHFVFTTSQGPQASSGNFPHDFFNEYINQEDSRPQAAAAASKSRAGGTVPGQSLSIQEAKALYNAYNDQWNAIAPSDPGVPYPGRDLQSVALANRGTIWAPLVSSPVASWSVEDVVRANTQTFFLAVADFVPVFSDPLCKIEMDFSHSKSTPAQLQILIDMLKKEKLRWHSDRLGRRNGGKPGTNEALQQHQVARGVFHAICELSDLATSKR